jgi:hypothetical protein
MPPESDEGGNMLDRVRLWELIVFAALLATTLPASAAVLEDINVASAQFNVQGCRDFLSEHIAAEKRWSASLCVSTVLTMDSYAIFLPGPYHSCTAKGATPEQLVRAVVQFIDDHPTRSQESFAKLTLEALSQAWPCPTPSSPH